MSREWKLWKHPENGNWYAVRTEHNGKRYVTKRRSLGTDEASKARARLAELEAPANGQAETIAQLIDHWIAGKDAAAKYRKKLQWETAALRDFFGALHPSEVTPDLAKQFASSRDVNKATVDKEIRLLRAILSHGRKYKLTDADPYLPAPGGNPGRLEWLTRDDARRLLAEAESNPHLHLFIRLALFSGQRHSAILRLKWSDVDFASNTISFTPASETSNKRAAKQHMDADIKRDLLRAREFATTDHVIEYRGKPVSTVRQGFENARDRAGLRPSITRHVLKHTAVSWRVQAGVSFRKLAAFFNTSEKILESVYGHLHPEHLSECGGFLNGLDDSFDDSTRKVVHLSP